MKTIAQIKKKYTRRLEAPKGYHRAYITVGVQTFCITEGCSKERAEWFRNMAAEAIKNLLKENQ